ncbi:putative nucleotidyltransferase-like protein [Actinomycetospora succinea]|uniref:Putative nucleotidyltransferase-like protein n=1 Tax=Actinomycetospora succinea TaxID=663603 RepID=A0A4V3DBA7_9PSEU|nr:nucleotidyltransferase [Actinomycetospora succinea]TDQ65788.1 putative nucleotidyltransferase-like protein [Actinomycetospora succinea]
MSDPDGAGRREALKRVAVSLREGGVGFALAGGYAGWALGGPEPENDVDFVVTETDAGRAAEVLAAAGLDVAHPPEDWLFKVYSDGAMVDVLFRLASETVDDELLGRAVEQEVLSVRMPVVDATDLIIGKLAALNEHACDLSKVLPTARALREKIDWPRAEAATADNDLAVACLFLLRRLRVAPGSPTP